MIVATKIGSRKVFSTGLPESLRMKGVRALLPGYQFWDVTSAALGADLAADAKDLDTVCVSPVSLAPDGTVRAVAADGTLVAVAIQGKDGTNGKDGIPQRIEAYVSPASGSNGRAKVTFSKPFTTIPTIIPGITWSGDQMVTAYPEAVTLVDCTLLIKRSKGTLLLTSGPFETVPAGVSATVIAMGS